MSPWSIWESRHWRKFWNKTGWIVDYIYVPIEMTNKHIWIVGELHSEHMRPHILCKNGINTKLLRIFVSHVKPTAKSAELMLLCFSTESWKTSLLSCVAQNYSAVRQTNPEGGENSTKKQIYPVSASNANLPLLRTLATKSPCFSSLFMVFQLCKCTIFAFIWRSKLKSCF